MSFGRPHHCKRTLIRVLLSPESEKDDHVKSHTTVNEIHDDDPGNDRVRANVKDSAGLDEKQHKIRHLPVLHGGKLRGVISDRDLKMAFSIRGVDPSTTTIEEIAVEDPFTIEPNAKLDDVVRIMAEKRIGSALVVDNHKLVGIFTTTDALRTLMSCCRRDWRSEADLSLIVIRVSRV